MPIDQFLPSSLKKKPRNSTTSKIYPCDSSAYKLKEEIGRGGSATVYKAECLVSNEVVAIKKLDLEKASADLNNIRKEAQLMRLLSHPNVLTAYCTFTVDQYLWVVMPFMAGGSFENILKSCFPTGLEEPVIVTVLKETLKALDYLHKEGHIHRDVKAGNILIDRCGSIKLADFGVSACVYESGDRDSMRRRTLTGTISWMAPEVILGDEMGSAGYDYKADIWSFGITAIELAHGRPPFCDKNPMEILRKHAQGIVPIFEDKKFSKNLREVVAMCLVSNPAKRPSAEKLLKHHLFKHAKTPHYLVKHVLDGLPCLSERVKIANDQRLLRHAADIQTRAAAAACHEQQEVDREVQESNNNDNEDWQFNVATAEIESSVAQEVLEGENIKDGH